MIEFHSISKSFSGNPVLREVSFRLPAGQILGLIGENGAGKSTLMNILGGDLQPDSGRMFLGGEHYAPRHPKDATRQGIAFIHQELNLFPNLTIAENLFLTSFPRSAGFLIDRGTVHDDTARLLKEVGLPLPPDTPLERLSAGERQLVEIAKALSLGTRLVIFDEPTTSLSAREAETLFGLIGRLSQRGLSVIYISHTLQDVLRLCQHIVVLRDGQVVGAGPREEFTVSRLISMMIGRNLEQVFPARRSPAGPEVVLEAKRLTHPGIVREVTFQLRRGEVLGLSGLMGAGRSELARILFGLDRCEHGEVLLKGRPISHLEARRRIQRGLAFLTENRREEGLCLEATIADNIALVALPLHTRLPLRLLDASRLRTAISKIREAVRLTRTAPDTASVKTLSGGNQQKVVLAKWLLARPEVLILDEPTRGIDVGAKFDLYQLILQLADEGAAIVMISSELEELLGICDRVLVMKRGEITGSFERSAYDRARILSAAIGGSRAEEKLEVSR